MTFSIMTLSITAEHCYAECHYAQCRHAECRCAESRYPECRGSHGTMSKNIFTSSQINETVHACFFQPSLTFVSKVGA